MNVTCPECRSVFRVDPARLPGTRVRARCSVCGGVIAIAAGADSQSEFSAPAVSTAYAAVSASGAAIPWRAPVASPSATPRASVPVPAPSEVLTAGSMTPVSSMPAHAPSEIHVSDLPPLERTAATSTDAAEGFAALDAPEQSVGAGETVLRSGVDVPPPIPSPATSLPLVSVLPSAPLAAELTDTPFEVARSTPPRATTPVHPISPPSSPALSAPDATPTSVPAVPLRPAVVSGMPAPFARPSNFRTNPGAAAQMAPFGPRPSFVAPTSAPAARPSTLGPTPVAGVGTPTPASTPVSPRSSVSASPIAPRTPINPFLANDPNAKAKRLARALVSDIVVYFPQKRDEGIRDGTLKQLFREEIKKSYEEYIDQIGREFAESTTHFQDALNDVLAGGKKLF